MPTETRKTPRPQGAKYLRAGQWADWFQEAIASPSTIQLSKTGAQDLVSVLRAAENVLQLAKQPAKPALTPLPMSMDTLRVPPGKRRPKFTDDVPLSIRSTIWRHWLQQHAESERPYLPLSREGAVELARLLESAT